MTDYRYVIGAFIATALLIGGLASWVAYERGELGNIFSPTVAVDEVELPLSLEKMEENQALQDSTNEGSAMNNPKVTLKTTKGDVVLELFTDKMPVTAGNFLDLVEKDFYNGTKFHRVIDGFMVQGGDPNSKGSDSATYGRGGPGYAIKDEFVAGLSNVRGTISMANSGPNSGGSQFFINLVDNTGLDYDKPPMESAHPVFGRVISGMEIVDAIGGSPTDANDLPLEPIVISSIEVAQ